MAVPIVGIQANIVEVNGSKALHFTKIVDSYQEPEESELTQQQVYDEKHWEEKYPWTLDCARWYKNLLERFYGDIEIKYFDTYISFTFGGLARVWVTQRKKDRSFVEVKHGEEGFQEAVDYMNNEGVAFRQRANEFVNFNANLQQLEKHATAHEWLAKRLAPKSLKTAMGSPSAINVKPDDLEPSNLVEATSNKANP